MMVDSKGYAKYRLALKREAPMTIKNEKIG
jgi:hypothetical protein